MTLLLLLLGCSGGAGDSGGAVDQCDAPPSPQFSLPSDDGQHAEPVEWWYWTGHLTDDAGRMYGFEEAFFVFQMGGYRATSAHVALTDVDAGEFRFDVAYAHDELPDVLDDGFSMQADVQSAVGGGGSDQLGAAFEGVSWTLDLTDEHGVVAQHGDGYSDYEFGGYTWYYSRPRMRVSGVIGVDGQSLAVTGEAWFDHQWGDLNAASNEGWDWFGIQLEDGTDIMLSFESGGGDLMAGSVRSGDCVTDLAAGSVTVVTSEDWVSDESGCAYPQQWEFDVDGRRLVVRSVLADQELPNSFNTYWEGAAVVEGDAAGRAYVELAGGCNR